ncbi:MAG: DUF4249 family protein [Flavobacteriaceae bacterium]|nr:MAG: DUF4249 family protein [Flavobacteriaceae bacterium]
MKIFKKIIAVLCIIIISSCEDVPDFDPGISEPVVEAFIYEGESVDDIYLKKTVPFNSGNTIEPELISDAIITISSDSQDFVLSPVADQPGRYFYDGNDLSINIGGNYQLTFEYEDRIISSTTTIPSEPEGVDISPESIEIPEINSLLDLRDFRESFQQTIDVIWNNNDGSYYYLVIENTEDNPESIDPTDVLGGLGINFEFTTSPTQQNILELRALIHYTQYGMHKVTIYHVNEEYALLYETSSQDSRDLNEPFTNINNGLGIFSGFASQVVYFEVIEQ